MLKKFPRNRSLIANILFLLFLKGCAWLSPPGTEVVVPEPVDTPITYAALSPDGKKLLYTTNANTRFTVDLVTGKESPIAHTCAGTWLNEQLLFCKNNRLIDTQDYQSIELELVDGQQQEIEPLLESAKIIYQLKGPSWQEPLAYIVFAIPPHQNSYITNLPQSFQLPPGAPDPLIPNTGRHDADRVYSHNGQYYYTGQKGYTLSIYTETDDILLVELVIEKGIPAQVLGWMYDDSGVLFRSSAGMLDFTPHPIYKLKVPE